MSVTCLFQYTGIRIFNDHTCERRIICSTRSVYIFLEKKTPFSPNIIFYYITAPRLNKKYVAPGHQNLAGEFCLVGGEFSDLRCLMNTLTCGDNFLNRYSGGVHYHFLWIVWEANLIYNIFQIIFLTTHVNCKNHKNFTANILG